MTFELDWLQRWHQLAPKRVILCDLKNKLDLTYSDLYRLANNVAVELRRNGVGKGSRVAVLAKNSWFHVAMFFGAQRVGAILVPLNHRLTKMELQYIVSDADPTLILVEDEFQDRCPVADGVQDWNAFSDSVMSAHELNPVVFTAEAEDPCLLLYTSGTTGKPKGALINHRMLFWNSINTVMRLNIGTEDIHPSFAPFFHTGGWNILLTPFLHRGAKTILLEKFDAAQILELCEKEKLTMFFGVPTMLDLLAKTPGFREANLTSLKFAVVGGEPMPHELIRIWEQKGVPIRQGYGLTEFGPNVFSLSEEDSLRKIGSIGFPNFYIETRIVGQDGNDMPQGEVGELWLKGPAASPGYWRNDAATDALFANGWLKTGDLVRKDADGYFYVAGRKKEMYISGGENVYPAEIEQALRSHPLIEDAAVIGIPDEKWGEAGKAFVVCEAKAALNEATVLEFCRERLAKFKIPKFVVFLPAIPKSESGKILKRDLR